MAEITLEVLNEIREAFKENGLGKYIIFVEECIYCVQNPKTITEYDENSSWFSDENKEYYLGKVGKKTIHYYSCKKFNAGEEMFEGQIHMHKRIYIFYNPETKECYVESLLEGWLERENIDPIKVKDDGTWVILCELYGLH
jgi:hypothetical protein